LILNQYLCKSAESWWHRDPVEESWFENLPLQFKGCERLLTVLLSVS